MKVDEHQLPALYMLWPHKHAIRPPQFLLPQGYILRSAGQEDYYRLQSLLQVDGERISVQEWQSYVDKTLPDGLFVIAHNETNALVASAGAIHNPNPGRYYFPFGGELGYLIVDPEHRRRGLGQAVCARVVERLRSAGYKSIRVGVQGWRYAAIRTYLKVGFVPFIHDPNLLVRWQRVCEKVERAYTPDDWATEITD